MVEWGPWGYNNGNGSRPFIWLTGPNSNWGTRTDLDTLEVWYTDGNDGNTWKWGKMHTSAFTAHYEEDNPHQSKYVSMYHDGTNGYLYTGSGDLHLKPTGNIIAEKDLYVGSRKLSDANSRLESTSTFLSKGYLGVDNLYQRHIETPTLVIILLLI